jgi:hypothetical protein
LPNGSHSKWLFRRWVGDGVLFLFSAPLSWDDSVSDLFFFLLHS